MKQNIRLILFFTLLTAAGLSISASSVFDVFVFKITNGSTIMMGLITSAYGIVQLCIFFPVSKYGDQYPHHKTLHYSILTGIAVVVFGFLSFYPWADTLYNVIFLFLANGLSGFHFGIQSPIMQTLFTLEVKDQTEDSKLFSLKTSVSAIGAILGPIIALILFLTLGNEWEINICQDVLMSGLILLLLGVACNFFFEPFEKTKKGKYNDMEVMEKTVDIPDSPSSSLSSSSEKEGESNSINSTNSIPNELWQYFAVRFLIALLESIKTY